MTNSDKAKEFLNKQTPDYIDESGDYFRGDSVSILLDEYTQQVSVDFAKYILSTNIESKLFEATWEDIFNEWKSNQVDK